MNSPRQPLPLSERNYKTLKRTPDLTRPDDWPTEEEFEEFKIEWEYEQALQDAKQTN